MSEPNINLDSVSADALLRGTVLVAVPHYDDEVLACGGALALASEKQRIHLAYATDGDSSPLRYSADLTPAGIGTLRRNESMRALETLGLDSRLASHWNIPEGQVAACADAARDALRPLLERLNPDTVLVPFRFDQHPDHLALRRLVLELLADQPRVTILEYFVYRHFPLLPRRDIRAYIRPRHLIRVDTRPAIALKKNALRCFTSQITLFYPRQCRPVLSPALLDDFALQPETFTSARTPDSELLAIPAGIIRLAQWLQPRLKRVKEEFRSRWADRFQ